jgi:hypothetical protein
MPTCKIINGPSLKLVLRELAFGPSDIHDLCAVIGISKRNMQRVLNVGRLEARSICIVGWQRQVGRPGNYTALYGLRKPRQHDSERPKPLTGAQIVRRLRARRKASDPARLLPY